MRMGASALDEVHFRVEWGDGLLYFSPVLLRSVRLSGGLNLVTYVVIKA